MSSQKKAKLFEADDFKSAEIQISFSNPVSNTFISEKVKRIGTSNKNNRTINNPIQILEILGNSLTISLPKSSCGISHKVDLEINVKNVGPMPLEISLRGKVTAIDYASEDEESVTIEVQNPNDVSWKDFCKFYSKRQEAIHVFFKNVRGY